MLDTFPHEPPWSKERETAFRTWVNCGVYDRPLRYPGTDTPDSGDMLDNAEASCLYRTGETRYANRPSDGIFAWRELIKSGKVVLDDLP